MSEMVDRVAKAMFVAAGSHVVAAVEPPWSVYAAQARVAIAAMREPTNEMEQAFLLQGTRRVNFNLQFEAAIDAALSEKAAA